MSTPRPISDDKYGDLLATFKRSAFRLEARDSYTIGEERDDYASFLAGVPRMPDQVDWWKAYLDRVAEQTRQGKVRARVRVVDEPPTDYQRWMIWADPWYTQAGERICYLPRSRARQIGLALLACDWWLLDDEQVVLLRFDSDGDVAARKLITAARAVAAYRAVRDLAIRFSVPVPQITAA